MANRTIQLDATGTVFEPLTSVKPSPVREWVNTPEGRRPEGPQVMDDATGLPMWETSAVVSYVAYGRPAPEVVVLRYPSQDGKLPGATSTATATASAAAPARPADKRESA